MTMRVTKTEMCPWKLLAAAGLMAVMPLAPVRAETLTALHETDILAAVTKAQGETTPASGARLEFTLKMSNIASNSVEIVEPDPTDLLETGEIELPLAVGKYFAMMIAGAHSEAIHKLMEDELEDGFSLGLALGADDRSASYARDFLKKLPVPTAVYPEWGNRLRDAHTAALALGYKQGRRLLVD